MADDVVPDRLADAKHLAAAAGSAEGGIILWLIGEVERLRMKLRDEMQATAALAVQDLDEFLTLRGALQALVDATDKAALGMRHCADLGACPDWNDEAKKVDEARAVAVAVLGETDGD